jgi:cytochrome c oxidase subunit 2
MLDRTHRFRRAGAAAAVAIAAVTLASCGDTTGPDNGQNALRPAGPDADKILDLTKPFFWIAVIIGIGVTAGTIYVALRFRVKPGEDRAPVQTHGNTVLEVGWTIVPALILAVMAVPTIATVFELADKPAGPEVVNVTVTARQWWWQFHYDDDGNGVETANELHIPVNRPVALTLVGPPLCQEDNCYNNGVLHSFWVPELNGKKDVVPGRTQFLTLEANRTGEFLGQCAEYCGLSHADMRLRVFVHDEAGYDAWVRSQQSAEPDAELLRGVDNEKFQCATCHSFKAGTPGAVGPNLAKLADRTTFAAGVYELNYENLWNWVYDAPNMKPFGNLVQHMPSFKNAAVPMSEDEAKNIACFLLRNTATNPNPPAECQGRGQ